MCPRWSWWNHNLEGKQARNNTFKTFISSCSLHVMGFKHIQSCSDCGSDVYVLSRRFGFCSAWYISRKCTLVFPCGTPRCVQKHWSSLWTASHRTCTPIDHPDFSASLTWCKCPGLVNKKEDVNSYLWFLEMCDFRAFLVGQNFWQ